MKKIFSFCAAVLVALAANAATINIAPESPKSGDNIRREIRDHINAGDTLLLADGTYTEVDQIALDKSVVILAAEGARPVIKHQYYATLTGENTKVVIKGVKFDGSLYPSNDHCIRPYDDKAGKSLTLENCEFTGYPNYIIYPQRGNRCLDELIIKDCYFHDNTRSAVWAGYDAGESTNLSLLSLDIQNSTFANFTDVKEALIAIKNDGTESANQKVKIDHCTFYNYVKNDGGSYTFVDVRKATDVAISNCIFAQPTADMSGATYVYGGSIDNCLTYNTTGHRSSSIVHGGLEGDPKFKDAANGDYTLTKGSPAIKAGTDGKDLGDPRWEFFPKVGLGASFNGWNWEGSPFVPASDKKTASINVNLEAGNYELKIVSDGAWLTQKGEAESQYSIHREWNHADEVKLDISEFNMKFEADKAGEYTFTWTYADSALVVTFPDPDYYLKNNWERSESWTWKKMTQDGANYKLENVVFGGSGVSYYTKEEGEGNWIALDDAKWLGDKLDQLDTANFVFDPEAKTITATLVGEYKEKLPKGFYLVGKIKGVEAWDISDLNAEKMFAKTEVDGEYKLDYNLDNGDAIKVVDVYRDGYKKWYGEGANYDITEGIAGNVTIYFRPAGNDAWGYRWFDVVKKTDPAAIDNTEVAEKVVKRFENGQLIIINNGVKYNAQGTIVR